MISLIFGKFSSVSGSGDSGLSTISVVVSLRISGLGLACSGQLHLGLPCLSISSLYRVSEHDVRKFLGKVLLSAFLSRRKRHLHTLSLEGNGKILDCGVVVEY